MRVIRERLSATPGHVIGQGPAPGGQIVHCGGGGSGGGGGGGGDCGSGGLGRRECKKSFEFLDLFLNRAESPSNEEVHFPTSNDHNSDLENDSWAKNWSSLIPRTCHIFLDGSRGLEKR